MDDILYKIARIFAVIIIVVIVFSGCANKDKSNKEKGVVINDNYIVHENSLGICVGSRYPGNMEEGDFNTLYYNLREYITCLTLIEKKPNVEYTNLWTEEMEQNVSSMRVVDPVVECPYNCLDSQEYGSCEHSVVVETPEVDGNLEFIVKWFNEDVMVANAESKLIYYNVYGTDKDNVQLLFRFRTGEEKEVLEGESVDADDDSVTDCGSSKYIRVDYDTVKNKINAIRMG